MRDELQASSEQRIEELERTLTSLRADSEVAYVLLGLSGALAEVRSVEETLDLAVRMVPGIFGADRCLAARWDAAGERFEVLAHSGYGRTELAEIEEQAAQGETGFPFLHTAVTQRAPQFASDQPPVESGALITIPLVRWDEDFGALRIEFEHPKTFGTKDSALARGVARQVGVALNNARRFHLLRSLRSFGVQVGSRLRPGDVIEDVLEGAIDLLDAQGAWLYLSDPTGRMLMSAGGRGRSLNLPERLARISVTDEPWSALLGEGSVLVDGFGGEFGTPDDIVLLLARLASSRDPFMGALMLAFDRARAPGPEEREALSVLGGQAAQAIENARRFQRERSVAHKLQSALLRTESPDLHGFVFGALYEPADGEGDVGGDFYDVVDLGPERFGLVVGDVSGKGAEAAAQTAMIKYMLRAFASRNHAPSSVLFHLNNVLVRDMQDDRFATLLYAVIEKRSGRAVLASAGHPAPMILRTDGKVEDIEGTGIVVGAFEGQEFETYDFTIGPGDVLVGFTDGLPEARQDNDLFGRDGVRAALEANKGIGNPEELARALYQEARRFGRVSDDTAIVALVNRGER